MNYTEIIKIFQQKNKSSYSSVAKSSVLIPLIKIDNEFEVLFEIRSHKLRSQPGEICFPGGKMENNESLQESALRETMEELNISIDHVEIFGNLDPIVTTFNMIIYPFCGILHNIAINEIEYNKGEVDSIFTIPLRELLHQKPLVHRLKVHTTPDKNFPFHLIRNGKDYNWHMMNYDIYFYKYNKYVVWGITAKILKNFLDILSH